MMLYYQGNFINFMTVSLTVVAKSPANSHLDHELIGIVTHVLCPLLTLQLRRNTFHSLPLTFLFFISILLKRAKEV